MFNETSFLADLGALGASGEDTLWFSLGWPSRAAWKAQGRPLTTPTGVTPPNLGLPPGASGGGSTPTIALPGQSAAGAPIDTGGAPTGSSGGGGFSLSSIPLWVWIIGAAFLLMKK